MFGEFWADTIDFGEGGEIGIGDGLGRPHFPQQRLAPSRTDPRNGLEDTKKRVFATNLSVVANRMIMGFIPDVL